MNTRGQRQKRKGVVDMKATPKRMKAAAALKLDNSVHYDEVSEVLQTPSKWKCQVSESTDDLWVCLACAVVVSGGAMAHGPACEHASKTGHMLYMKVITRVKPLC